MAGITTHILDLARGRPAAGVRVDLYWLGEAGNAGEVDAGRSERVLVSTITVNEHGRSEQPLVAPPELRIGRYELLFHVGRYLLESGAAIADPPFLDRIPVRFGVHDALAHYHVPLLVAPWGYTTYRGS